MKFVHISIVDADTPEEAEKKAADTLDPTAWRKTGQIEGDATPARITDTVNAITMRYKQAKA